MHGTASWPAIALACWIVTATPIHTVDGDTFDAELEVWLGLFAVERVRVLEVDTPELKGATKPAALGAKQFTADWLAKGKVEIEACRRDAFGRVLGKVTRGGEYLADALIQAGHARSYKP